MRMSALLLAVALAGCGAGTVAAEGARATSCVEAETAIIDRCAPTPEGDACTSGGLTIEQTRRTVDCIRLGCDLAHEELAK